MVSRPSDPLAAVTAMLAWRPAGMAVHLIGLAVLARLLDPADFGTFAVAAAVYWLAEAAVDFGLSSHLLRARGTRLSEEAMSSAFGLWIANSMLGTAAFLAGAFAVESLTGNTGLAVTLVVLAAALPLSAPVLVADTRLRHALDRRLLAWLPVAAAVLNVGAAAAAAWAGYGATALAFGILVEKAGRLLLLLVHCRGRLGRPGMGGWRGHLAFGSTYTATSLLPKLSVAGRLAVIKGTLGADAVGLFNRAEAVARLNERVVLESIQPLVLPVMAHAREAGTSMAVVYLRKVDFLAAICWPAAAVVIVLAQPLVAALLGGGWSATVPLVQILALSALAFPVTQMSLNLFVLLGAERLALRIQVSQQIAAFGLVAVAAFISLPAVCFATALGHSIKAWRIMAAFKGLVGYRDGALGRVALRNAAVTAATGAGPAVVVALTDLGTAPTLAAAIALAGAGWLAALAVLRHPLLGQIRAAAAGFRGA